MIEKLHFISDKKKRINRKKANKTSKNLSHRPNILPTEQKKKKNRTISHFTLTHIQNQPNKCKYIHIYFSYLKISNLCNLHLLMDNQWEKGEKILKKCGEKKVSSK